jgi:hypothetical protein
MALPDSAAIAGAAKQTIAKHPMNQTNFFMKILLLFKLMVFRFSFYGDDAGWIVADATFALSRASSGQ